MTTKFNFEQPSYHIGNVGNISAMNVTSNGKLVINFSLAIRAQRDIDGNSTAWLSCTAWEEHAEVINKYLQKGMTILIGGKHTSKPEQDTNDKTGELYPPKYKFIVNEWHPIRRETSYKFDDNDLADLQEQLSAAASSTLPQKMEAEDPPC